MKFAVLIKNFPITYRAEDIRNLVRPLIAFKRIKFIKKKSNRSAILIVKDKETAKEAVRLLHEKDIEGNKLIVERTPDNFSRNRLRGYKYNYNMYENTIYLRDFPDGTTEEKLHEIFGKYGEIDKITLSEKVCFITFVCHDYRDLAVQKTQFLKIADKRVYVNVLKTKYEIANLMYRKINRKSAFREKKRMMSQINNQAAGQTTNQTVNPATNQTVNPTTNQTIDQTLG